MSELINIIQKNRFRAAAIMGALLLVVGISLFAYSTSTIQEQEQMLASGNLSLEDTWRIEGSLRWWRTSYATVFLPLTLIFAAFGTVGLVSQPLWTRLHRKTVLESFADNVRRASAENYERPKFD